MREPFMSSFGHSGVRTDDAALGFEPSGPDAGAARYRARLAFDIHDGPSQTVSAALLQLSTVEEQVTEKGRATEIARLRHMLTCAAAELAAFTRDLEPPSLVDADLGHALARYARDFEEFFGCRVRLAVSPCAALSASARIAVFRIVQEALCNAWKHGHATECRVSVRVTDRHVRLAVADNGAGFASPVSGMGPPVGGLGLTGMERRASMLGGQLKVDSAPGAGTTVIARIPRWRDESA